ncbi:MAG: response regulator [Candidatus Thermoplasmatota archaeon]|nr:response regulator [Candidatus Thermoplasmatota archaeon]MED5486211.1 response regulator [Candidatus Thermoplasmatota archaeon]|tara:strand:- start:578 stop:1207 length:630 start_codon:yes stop_codon:yes gene_type:complete
MVRVTTTEDPDARLVLIVDNNPMGAMRLSQVFTQMGWKYEICEDGDQAVDTYVKLAPDMALVALDIPTLDGHVAALEMRESDPDARIVFMAPRHQRQLAADATHSAGAVAWLEKPVIKSIIEENWEMIMGDIPAAPGLEDLDSLYPEDVDIKRAKRDDEDVIEVSMAMPLPAPLPTAEVAPAPKKKRWKLKILTLLILLGVIGAYYFLM